MTTRMSASMFAATALVAACQALSEPESTPVERTAGVLPPPHLMRDIVFVSDRNGNPEIYAMTWTGTLQTNLTQHQAPDLDPSWSPDGAKIVFERRTSTTSEIWLMTASGMAQTQLSHALRGSKPYAHWPRWSPDGSQIAFVRSSTTESAGDLMVVAAAGGLEKKLASDVGTPAAWSPDGSRLAFVAGTQSPHLFRVNLNGTGLTQLAPAGVFAGSERNPNPCWAPGWLILYTFASDSLDGDPVDDWGHDVLAINPDGGPPLILTDSDGAELRSACWSPDASKILMSGQIEGNGDIYVRQTGGPWFGGWENLTSILGGLWMRDRGYSPDGTKILYYRNVVKWQDDKFQVWVMRANGSAQTQLTTSGSNWDPAWRP